jgi:hypothetical protein
LVGEVVFVLVVVVEQASSLLVGDPVLHLIEPPFDVDYVQTNPRISSIPPAYIDREKLTYH